MPKGIPKHPSAKKTFLHRLKIAHGHLDRVIDMVENDEYCINVIHQSQAVQSALKSTDQAILKHHMETCVRDAIKNGKDKEVIDEIMQVLKKQ